MASAFRAPPSRGASFSNRESAHEPREEAKRPPMGLSLMNNIHLRPMGSGALGCAEQYGFAKTKATPIRNFQVQLLQIAKDFRLIHHILDHQVIAARLRSKPD